ncbi:MAG TPA: hypothetical protein ENI96_14355, partial [Sedimenticola thiotaurini]|nr:hypothetical protein [Sedimenticola thiotaurini]
MLSIRAAGALLPILVPLLLLPGTGVAAGFGLRCDDGPRKSWTTARQGWRPGMTARAPQLRRSP